MKKLLFLSFLFIGIKAHAVTINGKDYGYLYNPFVGTQQYVTLIDTNSIQGVGVTVTTTTAGVLLTASGGTFGPTGYVMTDSNSCTWAITINTLGALVSTLISCPTVVASRPCSSGQSLGLLLSITCP